MAKRSGNIAKNAKLDFERETNTKAISKINAKDKNLLETNIKKIIKVLVPLYAKSTSNFITNYYYNYYYWNNKLTKKTFEKIKRVVSITYLTSGLIIYG